MAPAERLRRLAGNERGQVYPGLDADMLPLTLIVVILAGLVILPTLLPGTFYLSIASHVMVAALLALSLNILIGYGGMTSLGHAVYPGVPAYAHAWLVTNAGLGPIPAAIAAVALGTAFSAGFGLGGAGTLAGPVAGAAIITLTKMVASSYVDRWSSLLGLIFIVSVMLLRQLGLKGLQILTNVHGRELSDPAIAPFWAAAEELGAVMLIHPNGFTEATRMTRFYFNNVVGNPLDTTLALHYLIFDGVMERHPGLKLIAVHGGGYLAAYSGRIDHAWGARTDVHGTLPHPPSTYLKRVFFDSVVFTPHQLRHLIEVFGTDQVLMGTDYPYDMAESDPVGHLASAGLDPATFAAIAGGNARKLFGL